MEPTDFILAFNYFSLAANPLAVIYINGDGLRILPDNYIFDVFYLKIIYYYI